MHLEKPWQIPAPQVLLAIARGQLTAQSTAPGNELGGQTLR